MIDDCECVKIYPKLDKQENIQIGDIVALVQPINKVVRAIDKKYTNVLGICTKITDDDDIVIQSRYACEVNTTGIICIGDKLTISKTPGKARAITYVRMDEEQFGIRSIGKVVGIYNVYDKVQVLLDVE